MKNKTKISLIIGLSLLIIGGIIFTGVMYMISFDFSRLSTTKYEVNTYDISEKFDDMVFNTNTSDITFALSTDDKTKIVCEEECNEKHNVTVLNNTLKIEVEKNKKWYEYIGINFKTPKITVYLSGSEFGNLTIKEDTGDIKIPADFHFSDIDIYLSTGDVENYASASGVIKIRTTTGYIKAENITVNSVSFTASTGKIIANNVESETDVNLKISTGKAKLSNISCKNLSSTGDTGDISLENVVAKEKVSIIRSTGDVKLAKCDGAEIFNEPNTGDVSGTLLSEKIFITKTDTGKVEVPQTITGGKCEITTDTGDIKITLEK